MNQIQKRRFAGLQIATGAMIGAAATWHFSSSGCHNEAIHCSAVLLATLLLIHAFLQLIRLDKEEMKAIGRWQN